MRRAILSVLLLLLAMLAQAQKPRPFMGYIYNKEYDVYIQMDFYQNSVMVPGQAIFVSCPVTLAIRRMAASGSSHRQR